MYIVTGANGFIGANLVATLRKAGAAGVACVDYFDRTPVRYPEALGDGPRVETDDLLTFLDEHAADVTGIYHLGACSDTTVTDRNYVMKVNYEYSQNVWQWCASHDVPLVYASSAATYGDGTQGYDDQVDPRRYQPMNLYGESKHRFDLWALEQADAPPRWAGVKYFNVFGPRETHKARMASMAFHWFHQIRDTRKAKLFKSYRPDFADGQQQRDFIYVKDAVAATCHLLDQPNVTSGLYNVGTGVARTFADLARAVFTAFDITPELVMIDMPQDLQHQYQYYTQATITKLREAGFDEPMHTLEDAVAEYVAYLHAQESAT